MKVLGAEGLKNLNKLTNIDLTFDTNTKITDAGLESFTKEGLMMLTNLTHFKLTINRCSNISEEGIRSLK